MAKLPETPPKPRRKVATAEDSAGAVSVPSKVADAPAAQAEEVPVVAPEAPVTAEPAPVAAIVAETPEPVVATPEPEPTPTSPPAAAPVAVVEAAPTEPAATPKPLSVKDTPMSETLSFAAVKTAFADLQAKAKANLAKGQAALAEANAFAKGNLEAVVESSKLATAGLQELTGEFIAESKAAFETLSAEAKDLAAVKSPTDFFKLHSELTLKHFDEAIAYGSKQSEKLVKFASDVSAPLTARFSLAVEKLQAAA